MAVPAMSAKQTQALLSLIEQDWDVFAGTRAAPPGHGPDPGRRLALAREGFATRTGRSWP
jgi:hypothetical protein